MIARASQLFLPTLRDAPADAEAVSHKLLVRGGFIRQVGAGLWTFLPLGWRVHRKVEQIIREEMDAIGAQEFLAPVLTPVELWEATGRDKIPEIFHVTDRAGRRFILPLTHEETFTFHAREIQSYKELPQLWYHFQTKDRDEPRPRGGLLRVREFIMKDAYSFDRDEESAYAELRGNRAAYHRIFERCGVEAQEVKAESGIMGGELTSTSWRRPARARTRSSAARTATTRPTLEVARGDPAEAGSPPALGAPEEIETPGVTTCEALAEFLGVDAGGHDEGDAGDDRGRPRRARADPRRRPPVGVEAPLGAADRLASLDRRRDPHRVRRRRAARSARSASPARSSPTRRCATASSSPARTRTAGTSAVSRRGATTSRGSPICASRVEGDRCPECGGALTLPDRDRGRPHLLLRRQVQRRPLDATFLDEDGQEKPLLGGSYGIGPGRVMAAIVEHRHDDQGIVWPRSVAPYDVHLVVLKGAEEIGEQAAVALDGAGLDVLLDDRDLRPGEKFADADLIGIPIRITAGKKSLEDGLVDVRDRATGDERRVNVADLGKEVR